ncbi:MAG: hypothetical protein ABIQ44_14740 [Chloroflexia bacterium]
MKNLFRVTSSAILLALVGSFSLSGATGVQAQNNCQTFKETGKTVCGKFLTYWNGHGGLRQQGYPISGEFQEVSDADGKSYTVQYFERAVFELHPEKAAPYDVLLSLLGKTALQQKYPSGPPAPPTASNPQAGQLFPETGQYVSGEFLDYWKANGGLAQQGYPISGRFSEKSDLDGKLYTVQYFERAVFELHPENDSANIVLLTQLGTLQFKKKYPNGEPSPIAGTPLQTGHWGGDGVTMSVQPDGTYLEFDCAHASVLSIPQISNGKIDVSGTFTLEHGGPVLVNENDSARPARFTGTSDGKTLNLTITYTDDNMVIGAWTLVQGSEGKLRKCL